MPKIKLIKRGNLKLSKSPKWSNRKSKKKGGWKKEKDVPNCYGFSVPLQEREKSILNPYGFACSVRCRHPVFLSNKGLEADILNRKRLEDDWISEEIYRKYTETDSRPISPDFTDFSARRSSSLPRPPSLGYGVNETTPETKQCQFHQRRVLILDLRRVKSVDVITRQNSITTSDQSVNGDDDLTDQVENRSSSAYPDSSTVFQQFSTPTNFSKSRSETPKVIAKNPRKKKKSTKERSTSPIVYERSTSPKILEGVGRIY